MNPAADVARPASASAARMPAIVSPTPTAGDSCPPSLCGTADGVILGGTGPASTPCTPRTAPTPAPSKPRHRHTLGQWAGATLSGVLCGAVGVIPFIGFLTNAGVSKCEPQCMGDKAAERRVTAGRVIAIGGAFANLLTFAGYPFLSSGGSGAPAFMATMALTSGVCGAVGAFLINLEC